MGSLHELGEGYGFRKIRRALAVEAFGVNAIVMPPRHEGFEHYHEQQDELYFVHQGTARVEVEGQVYELGPGGRYVCALDATDGAVEVPGCEGLTLDLDALWREIDELEGDGEG